MLVWVLSLLSDLNLHHIPLNLVEETMRATRCQPRRKRSFFSIWSPFTAYCAAERLALLALERGRGAEKKQSEPALAAGQGKMLENTTESHMSGASEKMTSHQFRGEKPPRLSC
jgi:hypothetical protein